jgi:hypothetical protein
LLTLALCGALTSTQSVQAGNHHAGDPSVLSLGSPVAVCISENVGVAVADVRNINVGDHTQTVLHLKAQGETAAEGFVNNLDTAKVQVITPINFTVVQGDAQYLQVIVNWTPLHSSDTGSASFITPDSKLDPSKSFRLHSNGHGAYAIPLGQNGIPQFATLTLVFFNQNANPNDCTDHASDINHLTINNQFVGIDTTAPAQTCGTSCSPGGGTPASVQ